MENNSDFNLVTQVKTPLYSQTMLFERVQLLQLSSSIELRAALFEMKRQKLLKAL